MNSVFDLVADLLVLESRPESPTARLPGSRTNTSESPKSPESPASIPGSTSATAWRWRITQPDGAHFDAYYTPEATQAEVGAQFPGATVEPLPDDLGQRQAMPMEAAELRRLVAMVYAADTEADRTEALALALKDAENALACYRDLVATCAVRS